MVIGKHRDFKQQPWKVVYVHSEYVRQRSSRIRSEVVFSIRDLAAELEFEIWLGVETT